MPTGVAYESGPVRPVVAAPPTRREANAHGTPRDAGARKNATAPERAKRPGADDWRMPAGYRLRQASVSVKSVKYTYR